MKNIPAFPCRRDVLAAVTSALIDENGIERRASSLDFLYFLSAVLNSLSLLLNTSDSQEAGKIEGRSSQ